MSEFVPADAELTLSLEGQAVGSIANNLTTSDEGYALDARQGKVLDEKKLDKSHVANNLSTIEEGWALDARQGKYLSETKVGFSDIANDLSTKDTNKVLSAYQGNALDEKKLDKSHVANNLVTIEDGRALDARQGKYLNENKVGFSDIVNDLSTTDANKVLSAAQGARLKSELDGKVQTRTATLSPYGWSGLTQQVGVSGVTSSNVVLVTPAPSSYIEYHGCGVYCSAQADGSLTFTAVSAPSVALNVQILLIV